MVLNIAAFQAGWFACVLGAANGWAWAGTLAAVVIVAAHVRRAALPGREAALAAMVLVLGACCDSALAATGWLAFAEAPAAWLAPHWILAMWALFATTLNVSLRWLRGRHVAAIVLGALAGPAAYAAGANLGALRLEQPLAAVIALAAGWALILPLLVALARRYDGMRAA
jgi:hypothetical protein